VNKGNIVKFYHLAYLGVEQREVIFDVIAELPPNVKIVAKDFEKI